MRRSSFTIKIKKKRKRRVGRPRVTLKKILGSGINRPYKYKNRLMLGSGKKPSKQRGGFLPFAPMLAAATPVLDLLTKIIK